MQTKNGFLILDKGEGMSSHTAVSRVKRLLGAKTAGHTGTLDPMATGVLPILIERGVKASEYMIGADKHYIARMKLGFATDTEDTSGETVEETEYIPTENEVEKATLSMLGDQLQTPPMYSALKIGGKKLCDLAREGKTVERTPRPITVYSISQKKISDTEYELDVHCSKGTYIRTLCAEIGRRAGSLAAMKSLRRAECVGFTLSDAITLEELEAMSDDERWAAVHPIEEIFADYVNITLQSFFARLARSGLEIYLKKIGASLELGTRVKLSDEKGFFAIGEVRKFEAGLAIKPIKQFEL